MKKIMIVEDDTSISRELKNLLTNSGYEVEVLTDFQNSKEIILQSKSDLILLDINIPSLNGELLLKELRKNTNIPIIMVTSRVSEADEVLSMSYGADDYITKPYNPTILLLRIQAIFKRIEEREPIQKYRGLIINLNRGTIESEDTKSILTKNEMIIFQNLLNNKGKIVSRDSLMTDLWNNEEYINDNALTVNMSRLRSKLTEFGISDAIETRKGEGYILK